jgi:hypothetical protein
MHYSFWEGTACLKNLTRMVLALRVRQSIRTAIYFKTRLNSLVCRNQVLDHRPRRAHSCEQVDLVGRRKIWTVPETREAGTADHGVAGR